MITAKRLVLQGDLGEAVRLVNQGLASITGIEEEYISTLQRVMDAQLGIHVARAIGVDVAQADQDLKSVYLELNRKRYGSAADTAERVGTEMRRAIDEFKTSPEHTAEGNA